MQQDGVRRVRRLTAREAREINTIAVTEIRTTYVMQEAPDDMLVTLAQAQQQIAAIRQDIDAVVETMLFGTAVMVPETVARLRHTEHGGAIDFCAAENKADTLLQEWLSPGQLAQYRKRRHFEVIGSKSGKTYRIKHGHSMNVQELDGKGNVAETYCFVPQGSLAAGDIMLAQKIALENDEEGALAVANRSVGASMMEMITRLSAAGAV